MKKSIGMFLLGATLAFGLALSAYIIAQAAIKMNKKDTIRVKGSASLSVKSDSGSWSGTISVQKTTIAAAYETLDKDFKKAVEFVKKAGFSDQEMKNGDINTTKIYKLDDKGRSTTEIIGFQLSRNICVESRNVDAIETLSRSFTDLMQDGIYTSSNQACFIITDLDAYKMRLLKEATQNARERAEVLAKNSGGKVSSLINASQGIFQVMAPGGSDISDYGTYDKSTVSKEIKSVVTLEFSVE